MLRHSGWTGRPATPTCATPTCPTCTSVAASPSWTGPTPTTTPVGPATSVMEYPVGISYCAWGTRLAHALASSARPTSTRARHLAGPAVPRPAGASGRSRALLASPPSVFALSLLLAAWFLAGVTRAGPGTRCSSRCRRRWCSTALINWDLLAVVCVAGALWAWARGRPVLTGVLIGLGTATKLYPLFLLGRAAGGLLAPSGGWRDLRRGDAAARRRPGWSSTCRCTYRAPTSGRSSGRSTPSAAPTSGRSGWWSQQAGHTSPPHTINVGLLGVLRRVLPRRRWPSGCCAPATPRLAQLGFLVVAGFLLVNKVYSPQYVLWLLPLAALARPRWRDLLIWQAGEVLYFARSGCTSAASSAPGGGGDAGSTGWRSCIRIAAELYLVGIVVRDILRPWHDPVRAASRRVVCRRRRPGGQRDRRPGRTRVVV